MANEGRLGLIKYTGPRAAPFSVTRGGKTRRWSRHPALRRKWLPEAEALAYQKLQDFELVRWGGTKPKPKPKPEEPVLLHGRMRYPPGSLPDAPDVDALLKAAELLAQSEEQLTEEMEAGEYPFLMSSAGLVHRRTCPNAPTKPVGKFLTLEDARYDPRFKRFHRCIKD